MSLLHQCHAKSLPHCFYDILGNKTHDTGILHFVQKLLFPNKQLVVYTFGHVNTDKALVEIHMESNTITHVL